MARRLDEVDPIPGEQWASAIQVALQQLRERVVMTDAEFYGLEARARARAFTVSGVTELDLVASVWDAIDRAIEQGETLEDFRERVGGMLEEQWGGELPGRLETVFRTNVQSAYSAGRFAQNNSPEVRETHPFSRFSAILDGHETQVCHDLDGTILASDDPFWASHQPPLHFNCRSDVTVLTAEEAADQGIDQVGPDVVVQEGFGGVDEEFTPDLSTRPPALSYLYELKWAGQ